MLDSRSSAPSLDDLRWRQLFHRWFIQYNPLYLISAALVLAGVILLSQGLGSTSAAAQLGITAISEVYAWALIGGAALLVRIGLRRPAVMLAVLAALYQCDPTLHTETCAYLGTVGLVGSAAWLASFVAKLRALAWAMQLRVSSSAFVVTSLGAVMLALFPWLARTLDARAASSLLALGLFALFAAALWTSRRVEGPASDSEWATTVARRSLRATWSGWAAAMLVHAGFWLSQHPALDGTALLPAGMLLGTRFARRESTTWLVVGTTLLYVGATSPELFWLTSLMATATLALRALRQPSRRPAPEPLRAPIGDDVYRTEPSQAPAPRPSPPPCWSFELAAPGARRRLLTGALGCLYVAAWTHGWSGGPWPPHVGWLDLALVATSIALVASTRWRLPLLLPAASLGHLVVSLRLVSGPQSMLEWGITSVGVGFGLLLLGLVASVVWRHRLVRALQ